MHRSILWQLKQYQRDLERPLFINADQFMKSPVNSLNKRLKPKWADKLYPIELFMLYEDVIVRGDAALAEPTREDSYLSSFLGTHSEGYVKQFRASITPNIRRLILLRVLLGTFQRRAGMGRIAPKHRRAVCRLLGAKASINKREARLLFSRTSARSGIEDMILGRIGYLILWRDLGI